MLAESAITFRKASKAAAFEDEEEVEGDPIAADPLLFICAPVQRTESRSVRVQAGFLIPIPMEEAVEFRRESNKVLGIYINII